MDYNYTVLVKVVSTMALTYMNAIMLAVTYEFWENHFRLDFGGYYRLSRL